MSNHQELIRAWTEKRAIQELAGWSIEDRVQLWRDHFADWDESEHGCPPVWFPPDNANEHCRAGRFLNENEFASWEKFQAWWQSNPGPFWDQMIQMLEIPFDRQPTSLGILNDPANPQWLPGAWLNIVDSCFQADPDSTAVCYQQPGGPLIELSYRQLQTRVHAAAEWLIERGLAAGDPVALVMPMHLEAVVAYLAIVYCGCCVVSIADSFAPNEIAKRLEIAKAKAVVCCDGYWRTDKRIEIAAKVRSAIDLLDHPPGNRSAELQILLAADFPEHSTAGSNSIRNSSPAQRAINVLFSSGTTGDPKAILWDQTTPIKCAVDGCFHQDIGAGDVVVWPTNTGWMMGPWLIFATLINRATIGLFQGAPTGREFGQFVEQSKATMLGVVPALVRHWRQNECMEGLDWSSIGCFSSTGEASNESDMQWLSAAAGFRPIIEYCGGTEIGGGYISSTMLHANVPAAFATAAVGSRFVILDDEANPSDAGELFLIPPAMGLSNRLLNRDHEATYYQNVPDHPLTLRRHGDRFLTLSNGYYRASGRMDDTMNPGGIKIGSAEIETVVNGLPEIVESAVIAISVDSLGQSAPDRLVAFVVLVEQKNIPDAATLRQALNARIKQQINPLIRISDVRFVVELPRTASNKILRRELRKHYSLLGG